MPDAARLWARDRRHPGRGRTRRRYPSGPRRYDPDRPDSASASTHYTYDGRLWYALPDVIAAAILNPPRRPAAEDRAGGAARRPGAPNPGLNAGQSSAGSDELDPRRDDPFLADDRGTPPRRQDPSLDDEERKRLDRFLKITANATSYGVLARFDRREQAKPTTVTVYGPDDEPFDRRLVKRPEDPGPYCFPPVAASITAGARLMLALLERLVTDAGGSYAFCDTDSMAIVATRNGGPHPLPDHRPVTRITALPLGAPVEGDPRPLRRHSTPTTATWSPQAVEGRSTHSLTRELSLLRDQRQALRPLPTRPRRAQTWSPRSTSRRGRRTRRRPERSRTELVDWSEHGLGLYLDPTPPTPTQPRRDRQRTAALWIARSLASGSSPTPTTRRPGCPTGRPLTPLTRFTALRTRAPPNGSTDTTPARPAEERIRPGSFGLIAHPAYRPSRRPHARRATTSATRAIGPQLAWYDRASGQRINVASHVDRPRKGEAAEVLATGTVPVQTIGEVIHRYRLRPEHKSRSPNGTRPNGTPSAPSSAGRSSPPPPFRPSLGKEGNKLLERLSGEVTDPADYRADYGARDDSWSLVVAAIPNSARAR